MADFSDIKKRTDELTQLTPASEEEAMKLKAASYPEDYIDFMRQIGFGNLGSLQIYSAPVEPQSVYPAVGVDLESVVLFGDDSQGYCFGFDKSDGMRVIEVDPRGRIDRSIETTFASFVRGYFR